MKMEQVYRYTLVRDLRRPLSLLGCESVADGGDEDQAPVLTLVEDYHDQ